VRGLVVPSLLMRAFDRLARQKARKEAAKEAKAEKRREAHRAAIQARQALRAEASRKRAAARRATKAAATRAKKKGTPERPADCGAEGLPPLVLPYFDPVRVGLPWRWRGAGSLHEPVRPHHPPMTPGPDSSPRPCWHCTGCAGITAGGTAALCSRPGCCQVRSSPHTGCCAWEREPGSDDEARPAELAPPLPLFGPWVAQPRDPEPAPVEWAP
jgi:hypothetical protein